MDNLNFLDIHTHKTKSESTAFAIQNVFSHFELIDATGYYSAGLHPWYLDVTTAKKQFSELEKICSKENVLAIGECGLDKVCTTNMKLQEEYFIKQVQLANLIQKPIIIHCVRAFDEVLQILKKCGNKVPVIFHGFNKSANLADKILSKGHYLAFGSHLNNQNIAEVFRSVPEDRVFLETDDATQSIEDIYKVAAQIKQMDLSILQQQIAINAGIVFGTKFAVNNE